MNQALPAHFARFVLIGTIGTVVHFAILIGGVRLAGAGAVLSSQLGAVAGALVNYILNRQFNYKTQAGHLATSSKFFLVVALGFALNGLCMGFFVNRWQWNYMLAQCVTTGLVLMWNFAANHYWTFSSKR